MQTMKSLLLIFFFFGTFCLSAQTTDNIIHKIEKTKNEIENKKYTFKQNTIKADNISSKVAYFKDDHLQLVSVRQNEANIDKKVNWYFENGELFLSETCWFDQRTSKFIKTEKQYLRNGHLLAWLKSDNKFVDINSSEFILLDKELAKYGQKIMNESIH